MNASFNGREAASMTPSDYVHTTWERIVDAWPFVTTTSAARKQARNAFRGRLRAPAARAPQGAVGGRGDALGDQESVTSPE